MNKKLAFIGGVIIAAVFLTGCCLKHDWEDATCKEPMTCSKCGKTEGDKLDHEWIDATCTEPKTCELCGKTKGEALGHNYSQPTCTEPMICANCGDEEGIATGHEWATVTCTEERYCYNCGESDGQRGDHLWADATCFMPKTCWLCDATEGERLPHTWSGSGTYIYCTGCFEYLPDNEFEDGYAMWLGVSVTVPSDFELSDISTDESGVFSGESLMFTVCPHWNTGYDEDELIDYYRDSLTDAKYNILDEEYYNNCDGVEFYRFKIEYDEIVLGYSTLYIADDVYVYMECFAVDWDEADELYENTLDTFYIYY